MGATVLAYKKDIRALTRNELHEALTGMGEPAFRARQVEEWLWQKAARSFGEMTNLSKPLRQRLAGRYAIQPLQMDRTQISSDGTVKSRFRLRDGHLIEGVLIPAGKRMTACVSSQVGCSLSCKFCATGFLERKRNLEAAEIFDQVVLIDRQSREHHDRSLSNIVFMGMGEPLLNYRNVITAIERLTSSAGWGMSPKRITVSTAGIAKMIKRLGDDAIKFNLALSLHAANDQKRDCIMPINAQNNLQALTEALRYFYQKTKSRLSFEYILFDRFNDGPADARELIALCQSIPGRVNLIEYNAVDQVDFQKSRAARRDRFMAMLEQAGVTVTLRISRGEDIDAACGQLANK